MRLAHYDDGKLKYQSHEIYLKETDGYYHKDPELFSHDITDVRGYGETKEEALEDFKKKFSYLLQEYKALEKLLFETDVLTNDMAEVDCFGKEI